MIDALAQLSMRLRRSDLVQHGTLVLVAVVFANAFTYVYYALVGRIVGVESYGIVSALFSATLFLATAPATVMATIIVRLAADLQATGNLAKLRRLGDVVTMGTAIFGVLAFIAVAACSVPISHYFHLANFNPVIAAGLILALAFALPIQRGVLQGTQHFGEFAASNIIETTTKAIAGPLLALRFGASGALAGLCVGSLIAAAYNVFALRRSYGAKVERLHIDVPRMIEASIRTAIAVLAINALLFYDVVLVRHFFSPVDAGLYGAASLAGRALYTVVSFVPTVLLPKASARLIEGVRTVKLLAAALGAGLLLVAVALLVIAVAPALVVTILAGRSFAAAATLVLPYTIALGALALANIVAMYQIATRRFRFIVPLGIVAVVEIVTVSLYHPSIGVVLDTLVVGHCAACVATLYGLPLSVKRYVAGAPTP